MGLVDHKQKRKDAYRGTKWQESVTNLNKAERARDLKHLHSQEIVWWYGYSTQKDATKSPSKIASEKRLEKLAERKARKRRKALAEEAEALAKIKSRERKQRLLEKYGNDTTYA